MSAMPLQVGQESTEAEALELRLLLEAVLLRYGYDFRGYSRASLRRRIHGLMEQCGAQHIGELIHRVLHDPQFCTTLLLALSINVTELFRDPPFFVALRELVLPELARQPHFKVWHAGCSTGEEVYSFAIVLHEAGLLQRARIFATDFNEAVVSKARAGVFPLDRVRDGTSNYQQAGGTGSFASYYTARYDSAILSASLRQNILFAVHDLVCDTAFGEMDMIICRNVLIYFNQELQERVVALFAESLKGGGVLCLGSRESVRFTPSGRLFEELDGPWRIYRRRPRDAHVSPAAESRDRSGGDGRR